MVVQTDKGLGLGVIKPKQYFQFSIKYHIVDARTYQCLIPEAAVYRATLVRKRLEKWIKIHLDVLNKEERKFLCTNLGLNKEPWGFLYLLFKVQKVLLNTRPIVLYCGNLLRPLGQLIAEWLQPLSRMHKSYFQYSFTLRKELDLQKIPSNARLFICGATFMYTNIRTSQALHLIGQFVLNNDKHMTVQPAVLMDALHLFM